MPTPPECSEERSRIFMKYLYEEKNLHKNHRFLFVQRKLLFIGTLLGFSSLSLLDNVLDINFSKMVYLVPLIAIAFDIFILAEDFKVKRIGAFLSEKCQMCSDEKKWEFFVRNNREPLAAYGTVLLTILAFLASASILIIERWISDNYIDWWSLFLFLAIMLLYVIYYWKWMKSIRNIIKYK